MTSKKNKARAPRETNKKIKKKTSVLVTDKVEYVDYKDVNLLQRFVSDRSKIRGRRVIGNDVQASQLALGCAVDVFRLGRRVGAQVQLDGQGLHQVLQVVRTSGLLPLLRGFTIRGNPW
jgi:ribosomal protein S18